ncbi:MAG: alpha/beta hydrolase [Planctomycetaceae bacterium]|nr:alpha/beta hydrolase [Planctomycetales bacterium]MCB9926556.1 alpha/beta hydrolase [Planctomycetaceae bacterium]
MPVSTKKFSEQKLEIAGKQIHINVGGTGSPLVYLHSAGGETDWMPFHDDLAKHFEVQAPAHPGFGMSTGLDQIDDIHDMAWHYVDLFEQMGWKQIPVVGFSLGAWIALEVAILRPELINKIVLVAAAGLRIEDAPMAELFLSDFKEARELVFYNPDSPVVKIAMPLNFDDSRVLMWMRAQEATARVGWNPYLHNPKLRQHLHRVRCPVHIIWGRDDKLIPVAHGEYYESHLPDAHMTVFEQCGHMVPFEKKDEFVDTVVTFLSAEGPVRRTPK